MMYYYFFLLEIFNSEWHSCNILFNFHEFIKMTDTENSFIKSLCLYSPFSQAVCILFYFCDSCMNRQYLFLFQQFNKISNTYKSSYNRADCLSSNSQFIFHVCL